MSMYCKLFTVSDLDIDEIKRQPLKLEKLHYGEIINTDLLDSLENKNEILNWSPFQAAKIFDVKGSFNSINFLLTGETEATEKYFPLNFLGYVKLGIGEIGWGQASFFYSHDIKTFLTRLTN